MNGAFLGGLLGLGGSLAPAVLDYFSSKNERKHIEAMAQLGHVFEYLGKEADATSAETVALLDHDKSLVTENKFIQLLRASIRPVITYTFFILFLIVKLTGLWVAWFVMKEPFATSMLAIWDTDTSALFAAVMGFWFGNRAISTYGFGRRTPALRAAPLTMSLPSSASRRRKMRK